VHVKNIAYKPGEMKVLQGTEVTWVNEDKDVRHTVTSGEGGDNGVPGVSDPSPNSPDGVFDGDLPKAGDEFAFTFDEAGEYPYFCVVHPSMSGTVVVE
jgi:plastocyanin